MKNSNADSDSQVDVLTQDWIKPSKGENCLEDNSKTSLSKIPIRVDNKINLDKKCSRSKALSIGTQEVNLNGVDKKILKDCNARNISSMAKKIKCSKAKIAC